MELDQDLQQVGKLMDMVTEFAVQYGFQILGALIFLVIGLKVASWAGKKVNNICLGRDMDQTLAGFTGNIVKILIIVFVAIATLSNFGISIAPLIALAGASAFGATLAIQGPLSNYGAGLSIILGRPFKIGSTVAICGVSGVVEDIKLAATELVGEDGERITVPNKQIVGEVIVNSHENRIVEARIPVASDRAEQAIDLLKAHLQKEADIIQQPGPQVGVHDFSYGGVILGLRYWVPSQKFYQLRYRINAELLEVLTSAGIPLLSAGGVAMAAANTSGDEGVSTP